MRTAVPAHFWRGGWLSGLLVAATVGACLLATGCVQRRMMIRSNPPGATLYVDDYEIGVTPIAVDFTYYGTRKIRLVKDGYETLTILQPVPPPWYEIVPLDFFAENVVPGELRDWREFAYQLRPQIVVPPDQLLSRAEQLRRSQPQPLPRVSPGVPVTVPSGTVVPPGVQPAQPLQPETVPPGAPILPPSSAGPSSAPPLGGQPLYPLPPGLPRTSP